MTVTLDLDPEILAEALAGRDDACSFDHDGDCQTHDLGPRRSDHGCAVATVAAAVRSGRLYPQRTSIDPHPGGAMTIRIAARPDMFSDDADAVPGLHPDATDWERGEAARRWHDACYKLHQLIGHAAHEYASLTSPVGPLDDMVVPQRYSTPSNGIVDDAFQAAAAQVELAAMLRSAWHHGAQGPRQRSELAARLAGEVAAVEEAIRRAPGVEDIASAEHLASSLAEVVDPAQTDEGCRAFAHALARTIRTTKMAR